MLYIWYFFISFFLGGVLLEFNVDSFVVLLYFYIYNLITFQPLYLNGIDPWLELA